MNRSFRYWRLTPGRPADAGAVAVVVALCVAAFVLPISAMAVDLGMLYARKARLADIAEQAAKAGAQRLPDVAAARGTALANLCSTVNQNAGWDPAVICAVGATWPSDGNTANGEIQFREGVAPAGSLATTIRVIAPPATVRFAFAGAFGDASGDLQQRGAATLGTAVGPVGMAPFHLLPTDLGHFCIFATTTVPAGGGGANCNAVTADRGLIAERRTDSTSNLVERNIKHGLTPTVHNAQVWPCAGSTSLTACQTLPPGLDCLVPPLSPTFLASPLVGSPGTDINCVRVQTSGFGSGSSVTTQLRRGLISTNSRGPARLTRSCGGPTYPLYHGQSGIDSSQLFSLGSPWINPGVTTTELASAQTALESGLVNPLGKPLFTARIFECPRFSVASVMDTTLPPPFSAPVSGFRYLWIGGALAETTSGTVVENGLIWNGSGTSVWGIKGYAFDASYLPPAPRIAFNPGAYLGPGLASAVSLTDAGGP